MYVKQHFKILFYLKRKKATADGKVPIYVRITIDGLKDETALGVKITPENWDNDLKRVNAKEPSYKAINKKIDQSRTDLERHFDLIKVQHEIARPSMVIAAYKSPVNGEKTRNQQSGNDLLSQALDELIYQYIDHLAKTEKAYRFNRIPPAHAAGKLEVKRKELDQEIEKFSVDARKIFDQKDWVKTLVLALDENLLHFLRLVSVEQRSINTLEKMIGKKQRIIEFMNYRYKTGDIPLSDLDACFLEEIMTFLLVKKEVIRNTAMKYAQHLKEVLSRSVKIGWIPSSRLMTFKCSYSEPRHDWLTVEETLSLYNKTFSLPKLNLVKDLYVFSSYTGLSYAEMKSFMRDDIMTGIDGKQWVTKDRQKTGGDETLPLLPVALELIERYKNDPVAVLRGRVFPVPSNEEYNRNLKLIGEIMQFRIILRTHKARFYFANEVAYNNGVPIKTVSRMLGQKSPRSVEVYVLGNRTAIAESMQAVEAKLFDADGSFKNSKKRNPARVVTMQVV